MHTPMWRQLRSSFRFAWPIVAIALTIAHGVAAADRERPDVAILLTDQQRADALSIAGTAGADTPAMDALARGGVRFTHAFCATPQCSPARAALLTGRYPHRTGVMGNVSENRSPPAGQSPKLDPRAVTLGSVFAAAGYQTAYFGKWHLGGRPAEYGFEIDGSGRAPGRRVTERVVAFLESRGSADTQHRPLLLIASWINPHDIYQINRAHDVDAERVKRVRLPANLDDDLSQKPFPQRHYLAEDQGKPFRHYTRDQWRRYGAFYQQLTLKVDGEVGRVVKALRSANPKTLIVFSSDHGDLGGAHGLPYKGPAMYEELIRVPLIISWPGGIAPKVSDALVSQLDLLPTLCALAGIDAPPSLDGRSLQPLLTGATADATPWRDALVLEYYGKQNWRVPIRAIRTRAWKFVRYRHYGDELYHLERDPHERTNLANEKAHASTRQAFAARLDRWMKRTQDPFDRLTVTNRQGRIVSPLPDE